MNRLRNKMDNMTDENISQCLSKKKDLHRQQQSSTDADRWQQQQLENDRLRQALLKAIEENEQLREQVSTIQALYGESANLLEEQEKKNAILTQRVKALELELNDLRPSAVPRARSRSS